MADQTYDDGRARKLEEMLRALAARIHELDSAGSLLAGAGDLTRLIGDVRSELFHYEVRATYDTPEIAHNRRLVSDATRSADKQLWEPREWSPDGEDEEPNW